MGMGIGCFNELEYDFANMTTTTAQGYDLIKLLILLQILELFCLGDFEPLIVVLNVLSKCCALV